MVSVTQGARRDRLDQRSRRREGNRAPAEQALIYGWSQGGGTVVAAASMPDYIRRTGTAFDGIQMAGFVALAPADVAVTTPEETLDEDFAPTSSSAACERRSRRTPSSSRTWR